MTYQRNFLLQVRIKDAIRSGKVYHTSTKSEIINNNELMKDLGSGNRAKGKKRFNQLLKRKLYWLYELEDIEVYILLESGYIRSNSRSKNKRLVVRDEKGYFEHVVCLLPRNENMQHMRDKEFIANLDRRISKLEWLVPGTQKRVDVMLKINGRIGIEIQNSALEYHRLEKKIRLLKCSFDRWFFIVPKKFVERYSYLDNEHGKIIDMKEAIKEIKEILEEALN